MKPKVCRPARLPYGTWRTPGGGRVHLAKPGHTPRHGHSGNTTGLHVETLINEEAMRMAAQVRHLLPGLLPDETAQAAPMERPYGMRKGRAICPDCFTESRRYDEETGRCPDCQEPTN